MFDLRMLMLRVASGAAIYYGATEFLREPQNIEDLLNSSTDIWNDVYDWGQNKFMGVPDNSTSIQVKKSARQIYAEAFMDDLEGSGTFGRVNTQFQFDDEDAVREANEKYQADLKAAADAQERQNGEEAAFAEEDTEVVDLLDSLTGNVDEDEDEEEIDEAQEALNHAEE